MMRQDFDFYAIGDAALELGVARSNLRYFIDMQQVPSKRASDGSRLMTHDDLKQARVWINKHEAEKKAQREARQKKRRQLQTLAKKKSARSRRK